MDALLRTTADYLRTRVQFGRPLATNQVLRHRMADFKVGCEEARSMTQAAVLALAGSSDELDALVRARIASGARAKVGALARRACEEAIQLHGGMGVTEELPVGVYLKRQLALDAMLGSPDWHLRRHASLRAAIAARNIEKGAGQ
jgi:alkylation response protein AidB-like acyl-CoA dehydrogenase